MIGEVTHAPALRRPATGLDAVRTFNRYELKYVADRRLVAAFRESIGSRVGRDPHGIEGFYPVWSRYYDTSDLTFYWQKIDGIRFRRKLRIRHYGAPDDLVPESRVWVEIKQRLNRVTQKRRVLLPCAFCPHQKTPAVSRRHPGKHRQTRQRVKRGRQRRSS